MLGILSAVVGLLVLLWMFYDFFWPPPPLADRQLGKPDQPVEYNLKHTVSFIFLETKYYSYAQKKACKSSEKYLAYLPSTMGKKLLVCTIPFQVCGLLSYRKSSIKPPSQIRPLPLISLPPFQGKKVNKLPVPSPNYSSLINDKLY